MGVIIDTERVNEIYRCNSIKVPIIYINLIGATLSLMLLLSSSFIMILAKKRMPFLTIIILLIFFSVIVNTISKLMQLLKYYFKDERYDKTFTNNNTPRGIICQIQIVTSIFSDFCTLLNTLLLSLRCYDVIQNKKRWFDKRKNRIKSIVLIEIISILLAIGFLLFDIYIIKVDVSYRFDVRDRCTYWCWLGHYASIGSWVIYAIILIFNIVLACKTSSYLKKGYIQLEENDISQEKINSNRNNMDIPLNDISKDKNSKQNKKYSNLTNEEKKRIQELRFMRIKCLVYPYVTIILWICFLAYRIIDDIIIRQFDERSPQEGQDDEKKFFEDHPFLHFLAQSTLFVHTLLTATRGIFYGFSFLIFEEKIFFNFFSKCFKKYLFDEEELEEQENQEEKQTNEILIRNTNNSSLINDSNKENNENEKLDESKEKSDVMNNSDIY